MSLSLNPLLPLALERVNDQVVAVNSAQGAHVGNLKRVGALWKFKAVGYDDGGAVMPGHGPLTDQHNMAFATWDEAHICAQLAQLPNVSSESESLDAINPSRVKINPPGR